MVPGHQPGPGAAACAELLKKKKKKKPWIVSSPSSKQIFPLYKAGKGADVQQVLHVVFWGTELGLLQGCSECGAWRGHGAWPQIPHCAHVLQALPGGA